MYERFFFLTEPPFRLTPDPKFLYLSEKHQEAMNLLTFGIEERRGFVLLTGEVGTGKTTLCRAVLDRLDKRIETALILNPILSNFELLKAINEDFGIKVNSISMKDHLDALNRFLLKKAEGNGNAVVIIDEAQNLDPKTLEMIRLLSNLETEKTKLIQIALVGQPELRDKLRLPELRQLNQRIIVRYHLKPLSLEETNFYIFTRLAVAGGRGNVRFTPSALNRIYEANGGIPRLINIVCDRVLTVAFVREKRLINGEIVKEAMDELNAEGAIQRDLDRFHGKGWKVFRYHLPFNKLLRWLRDPLRL